MFNFSSINGDYYDNSDSDLNQEDDDYVNYNSCDLIVLGAGSAGSIVAGIVSQNRNKRVCLFERGKDESNNPYLVIPNINSIIANVPDAGIAPIEKLTTLEPLTGPKFSEVYFSFALGGGPAVAGLIYGCSPPETYNEWASLVNSSSLNYTNLNTFLKRSENVLINQSSLPNRGRDGPIDVNILDKNDPLIQTTANAIANEYNVTFGNDYCNPDGIVGVWPFQRFLKRSPNCTPTSGPCLRASSYKTYVEPFLSNRSNLIVFTSAQVIRIVFSRPNSTRTRAEGVIYIKNGRTYYIRAKQHIVLSSGVINTPKLLMLSGIGDEDMLNKLSIPLVKNLKGVGKNLQEHVVINLFFYSPFSPTITTESTPLAMFFKSGLNSNFVDVENACGYVPTFFVPQLPPNSTGAVLICYIVQVRNTGSGTISLRSTNSFQVPDIQFNFDPNLMDPLIWSFNKTRNAINSISPPLVEIIPTQSKLPLNASSQVIREFIKDNLGPWHHSTGSCKMGSPSDPFAVVDVNQKVYGVSNLYIADNSIVPVIVPTHPATSANIFGQRLGDYLINRNN